ncbi:MFS transporter [Synoicihabitans lomoniglobus]|uniref:MFS transporter n=1 Tax=Synoicihabitans lomoniglobus TaxID=2909285 RepID=A0AAE9ZVP1_9BACT|nr:MFS transporter [Opitutaceae bacterium LMO-M01]WED65026.1 MFS transporter [Opitutaceae bacterium LMO-M01]
MNSDPAAPVAILPARRERTMLITLAAVQFTNIMDFMIMMPLGAQLMEVFAINPTQFSRLVAAYGLAAATSGFAGGFVLDRFDRKRALMVMYAAFAVATLACALAPTYLTLLLARVAAGACGGLVGSILTAMVGDVIPPERRGRAMSVVMSSFPLASIFGVPVGIMLATAFEWHAPFMLLAASSAIIWPVAARVLPAVPSHKSAQSPLAQMRVILFHPIHRRGLALGAMLVFAGASIVPFMAPSMVLNVGVSETQLPLIYLAGGVCTFFSMPFLGRMTDRFDKWHVLLVTTIPAALSVFILTHLPAVPLPIALAVAALFFVGMSGRFPPTMAMITNAVEDRYRGGFMSVISAVQQAAAGVASITAGLLVSTSANGRLVGYPRAGYVSLTAFVITVWLGWRLRQIAPFAARNPATNHVAAATPPSAGPAANAVDDPTR